jgi:outer membrane lipoprotein-sorting protein
LKNASFPSPLLNYKQAGVTIELAGKEKVGEREAFVLVVKPKSGPAVRQYIDAASYLSIKQVIKINVPQIGGELEQTTEFFDFKDVDGVKVPFRVMTSSAVQTLTVNISQVEHNVQIDQTLFSKPDAGK